MVKYLLFLVPLLFSCKKEDSKPAGPDPLPAPGIITTYTILVSGCGHASEITKDTLTIWINDVIKVQKIEGQITDDHLFQGKTGNKIRIRYNPGVQYYPNYNSFTKQWDDYISGQNDMHIYFQSKYPDQKFSCKCVEDYSLTL